MDPIGSLVEAFSPSLSGAGWDRYDYNPDTARQLLSDLCTSLNRDYEANPPRLAFTHSPGAARPDRARIGELVVEMLGDVGIEVDIVEQDLTEMIYFGGCTGWESSTWTWVGELESFTGLPSMLTRWDPSASANPADDPSNFYAWGTEGVTDAEGLDIPAFEACDETTVYNQGPSSVRDEFTRRVDDLLRQAEAVVDPADYIPLVLEMEEILADQAVIIPLYIRPLVLAWRADIVGGYGFQFDIGTPSEFWNVAQWYLVDS